MTITKEGINSFIGAGAQPYKSEKANIEEHVILLD
jgi:hypothetical protein